MKSSFLENNLRSLSYQRNIFAALVLLLSGTLSVMSCFLFLKTERVIVTPPIIEKEFWVEGNAVSSTYLEQYGCFIGQLLLGKSAQSAPSQRSILMRHTDPSYAGLLRQRLSEEEDLLQKQNVAYVFFPVDVKVDTALMEVQLTGDRVAYAAGKQISSERESYILSFNYTGSRLLLKRVSFGET